MERSEGKRHAILNHLSKLPQKVLSFHGSDNNIAEFVLYDLCNKNCFGLQKAAYLVDNPDFDCLKGIAGYSAGKQFDKEMVWETPEVFAAYMEKEPFNQKVRSIMQTSGRKSKQSEKDTTNRIGDFLGLSKPEYCSWQMKHDNHGILIYEAEVKCPMSDDLIVNGACLLGFCPIY